MPAYLQTWTEGVDAAREREGQRLEYAGSNQYPRIGVEAGDRLYIAYLDAKRLHLIGRLPVAEVIDREEARRRRGDDIWPANWYAVARAHAAEQVTFDLRIPEEIVQELRFERSTGEITQLHPSPDGALDGKALQRIRRLTASSVALLDRVLELQPTMPIRGRARQVPKAERDAVEQRAMEVAEENYVADHWTVTKVHLHRPYDLVCRKADAEDHVEVKGSTSRAAAVELTRNEVTHARTCRHRVVLAVVERIKLRRGDSPVATGGHLRLYAPWRIKDSGLEPLNYSHTLP